mmetsp:Transcript_167287/g.537345  ORF Transcript_167287/g.537345 Transcript_167287/m.537345 type:complete len:250 (+) Transcript_167287:545-1294(+)
MMLLLFELLQGSAPRLEAWWSRRQLPSEASQLHRGRQQSSRRRGITHCAVPRQPGPSTCDWHATSACSRGVGRHGWQCRVRAQPVAAHKGVHQRGGLQGTGGDLRYGEHMLEVPAEPPRPFSNHISTTGGTDAVWSEARQRLQTEAFAVRGQKLRLQRSHMRESRGYQPRTTAWKQGVSTRLVAKLVEDAICGTVALATGGATTQNASTTHGVGADASADGAADHALADDARHGVRSLYPLHALLWGLK